MTADRLAWLYNQLKERSLTHDECEERRELEVAMRPYRLAQAISTLKPARKHYDAHVVLYRAREAADMAIMGIVAKEALS